MWVARVLKRSDEYMRGSTCHCCKALNSKKLCPGILRQSKSGHLLCYWLPSMWYPLAAGILYSMAYLPGQVEPSEKTQSAQGAL